MVTASTKFGTSVFDCVNTVPGVCGAMIALAASIDHALLLVGNDWFGPGPPARWRHSADGPLSAAAAGMMPNVSSPTFEPAAENRYWMNDSAFGRSAVWLPPAEPLTTDGEIARVSES